MNKHDELKARAHAMEPYVSSLTRDAIAAVGELETLVAKLREGVVCSHGDEYMDTCGLCGGTDWQTGDGSCRHEDDCPMREVSGDADKG